MCSFRLTASCLLKQELPTVFHPLPWPWPAQSCGPSSFGKAPLGNGATCVRGGTPAGLGGWVLLWFMVLCTVKSGIWSPACHLGVSHNCRQGAAAPRSVGACNRASQKGLYCPPPPSRRCRASVPETLPGPGPRTLWTLMPSLSVPQLTCYRALHGLSKRHRLADGIHISPKSQPGTGSPEPGARSRVSPQWARNSPPHSALTRCPLRAAGWQLRAPGCTRPASSSEMAERRGLNVLPPECPAGRCGPSPGGAPHLYAPCSPGAPRGRTRGAASAPAARARLAGEGRRLGSSLPRGAEPPRFSAGGASFPRPLRLAPLFSPGPLRPAAEPRRPLQSARGCAPGTRRRGRAGVLPAGLGPSAVPGVDPWGSLNASSPPPQLLMGHVAWPGLGTQGQ